MNLRLLLRILGVILSLCCSSCESSIPRSRQDMLSLGPNTLYYEVQGAGDPIVWIHGGGVDHRMWQPQMAYFSPHYQVISYDIRGHGQSHFTENSKPDIQDLLSLIDSLGIEKTHLVGLSLGSVLATDFALAYPGRVQKLVLLSPVVADLQIQDSSYLKPLSRLVAALQAEDLEATLDIVDDMTFQGQRSAIPPGLDSARAYVREAARAYFRSGHYQRVPHLAEATPSQRLAEISCPTLIMYGQQDLAYIVKNANLLAGEIPQSQAIALPEAVHLINVEAGQAVNKAIATFLE